MSGTRSRKGDLPLEKQDALDMLASALMWCRQAGIRILAGESDGKLAVVLEGVALRGDRLVMSADMPALTPDPSPVADDRRGEAVIYPERSE